MVYHDYGGNALKKDSSKMAKKLTNDLNLLQRHVQMLKIVVDRGPIGIIRLSTILNTPQHRVRYSLRLLEKEGMINATHNGAVTTKKTKQFLAELEDDLTVMTETIEMIKTSLGKF